MSNIEATETVEACAFIENLMIIQLSHSLILWQSSSTKALGQHKQRAATARFAEFVSAPEEGDVSRCLGQLATMRTRQCTRCVNREASGK
jgi:hypothetical protein